VGSVASAAPAVDRQARVRKDPVLSGGKRGIVPPMTDLTLDGLRAEVAPLSAQVADLDAKVAPMGAQLDGLDAKVGPMRVQLADLDAKVSPMRAQLDGLPLINRSLTVLQQETRALRAAFNDFARTNVTAGEIEALHVDVNRVQAENAALQTRLATVERLLEEVQGRRP
jgi:chromosome segregation ATPase